METGATEAGGGRGMKAGGVAPPKVLPSAAWHTLSPEEVVGRLRSDLARGLTSVEAAKRLATDGPNRLPEAPGRSLVRMVLDQFANLLVAILLGAVALSAALGEVADAVAILAIILVNAVIGFVQERRAADALGALRRMTAPSARVRRDGATAIIPASDLVAGDLVVLEAGDQVPADVRLARSAGLRVVEGALTGESEPVQKEAASTSGADTGLADRKNMLYMGTSAAAGSAEGMVVATGPSTEFGRIAELVRSAEEPETPLQERLRVFGKWLVIGSGLVVALIFSLGLARGMPLLEMLLSSVSLAVAAVPEGLPAVVTVALALGVRRMAAQRSLVRRLASVETLGCTTVICTDKTGTLTVGEMTVGEVRTADDGVVVEGEGYGPEGRFKRGTAPATLGETEPAFLTLRAALACSTARLVQRDGRTVVAGDPMEGALIVAALKAGIRVEDVDSRERVLSTIPFDSERKRMSIVRAASGGPRAYVKGAAESVLPRSVAAAWRDGTRALGTSDRAKLEADADTLARRGLRVLAVAMKDMKDGGDPEDGLVFLGFVALRDPPRPEAKAAVAACREAGIRVVMITGDNPRTALAIARDLGIASREDEVLTGPEVESLTEEALVGRVEAIAVYARVSPEHKLRIVRGWKTRGAVVAMTGDGVNDAPALKGADIGIAMGRSGTDVAKDASAMVITDDNFATIVAAVEQGRAIFENIRKTLLYLLSGNAAEILTMGVAVVAGYPLPLLPIQLLWINLVTDGLPALALVTDPADGELLRQPPRRPGAEIADREFLGWMMATAVLIAGVTFGAFLYGLEVQGSLDKARTYAFSTMVIGEVLRAFAARSRTRTLFEIGAFSNLRLAVVAIASVGLQIFSHHSGILESFLKTGELTWTECLLSTAAAAVPVTILELYKLVRRAFRPAKAVVP